MFLFLLSPPISLYTSKTHKQLVPYHCLDNRHSPKTQHRRRPFATPQQTDQPRQQAPTRQTCPKVRPHPHPSESHSIPSNNRNSTLPNPPHQPHQIRQKAHQPTPLLRGSTSTHVFHPPTQSSRRPNDRRSRRFARETQRKQDGEVQAVRGRGRGEAGTRGYLGWQEGDGWTQLNDLRFD